jgi:hypothetical protein
MKRSLAVFSLLSFLPFFPFLRGERSCLTRSKENGEVRQLFALRLAVVGGTEGTASGGEEEKQRRKRSGGYRTTAKKEDEKVGRVGEAGEGRLEVVGERKGVRHLRERKKSVSFLPQSSTDFALLLQQKEEREKGRARNAPNSTASDNPASGTH